MEKDNKAKIKPKYNMAQTSAFMIKTAWGSKEKKVIFMGLSEAILAVILNILGLYVSPTLISIIESGAPIQDLIISIVVFTVAMMAVSALIAYIDTNKLYGRITVRLELINHINNKASKTSYPNLFDKTFQELLEKSGNVTSSNSEATEAVWTTLTDLAKNILGFIFYIALLSSVQPILFLIVVLTSIASYFVSLKASVFRYEHRNEIADDGNHMEYVINVSSQEEYAKDIRLFGLRPWIEEVFSKALSSYTALQDKAESKLFIASVFDLVMALLRNGIAYAMLIAMAINGQISVAEFLLLFSAVGGFSSWVLGILGNFSTLHKQCLDISTVMEFLNFPEIFNVDDGKELPNLNRPYEIRLENVSYAYEEGGKYTLKNIDLTLHPCEKLAVVGLNGAGKTTLIKILCGFVDPTEGRVLIDGVDLKEYRRTDYYKLFSAVFQYFCMIPATVAANVAASEDDIDIEKVERSLEKAGLSDKIHSLKVGLETKLNHNIFQDAVQLSGGETQRLMLARALYKNAPFVVLDEPTAALDPIAEAELYSKYNEMTKDKSSVYISHRLASTRFCDRIILIDNGQIAEEGSHDELLRKNGKYAELFEVQSKYYREKEIENER